MRPHDTRVSIKQQHHSASLKSGIFFLSQLLTDSDAAETQARTKTKNKLHGILVAAFVVLDRWRPASQLQTTRKKKGKKTWDGTGESCCLILP